jgi:hypothetical protein
VAELVAPEAAREAKPALISTSLPVSLPRLPVLLAAAALLMAVAAVPQNASQPLVKSGGRCSDVRPSNFTLYCGLEQLRVHPIVENIERELSVRVRSLDRPRTSSPAHR